MSSLDNLIDQENRPQGGGPLGRRTKVVEVEPTRLRSALGEISQNQRRQPLRNTSNKPQGFSIYCDENAPSFSRPQPILRKAEASSIDKENIPPKEKSLRQKVKTDVLREQNKADHVVQVQQTRTAQLLHSLPSRAAQLIQEQESMNTSVDLDSPMVVEETVTQLREQWRVPPIKDNHTVDIFTEPEYFQDIYMYLKESEYKQLPKFKYMEKQNDITHSMRSILVDWLVEVGEEYKLQTETLHLAVNYIDRFLSYMAVQRTKLQLVGAACMFIAAKYEEIYPPDVAEFVYITDDTYNKRQVLRMEHLVLKVLGFNLSVPTSFLFLNKMVEMVPVDEDEEEDKAKVRALAAYLAELALVDGETFLKYPPSQTAAACVALARHTISLDAWPQPLPQRTGFTLEDLQECFVDLHRCFEKSKTAAQQAVAEKYRSSKYFGVSDLSPPSIF